MSRYTDNYNFILADKTEKYDVDVANTNNIKIDAILNNKIDKKANKDLSTNDFTDGYKKKLDALQKLYQYKGSLNKYSNLLEKYDNKLGDVWNILESNTNYCWSGTEWIELGSSIDLSEYATNKGTKINKYIVTTETEIKENTDYEIPCYYKVGQDVLDIFYMGEKLVKGTHYIEVGENGAISNKIQFYDWGQSVPAGRTIEIDVKGVYSSES